MTANELNLLIDILERRGEDRQLEAATMLRNQQAEIEQLKALAISLSPNANLIYTRGEK